MKYYNIKADNSPGPYEKFMEYGVESLTDEELLAIILRTGTKGEDTVSIAGKILSLRAGMGRDRRGLLALHHLSLEELMSIKGIGRVKAIKLKAVAELSSRISKERIGSDAQFKGPATIAAYYMETMRHWEHEGVILMMFDGRFHLIADNLLGKGTVKASLISPREVLLTAVKHGAVNIVLLHNHPGGDPSPSEADISVTERIAKSCAMADIPLCDHIIIGDGSYYSFRENNLL